MIREEDWQEKKQQLRPKQNMKLNFGNGSERNAMLMKDFHDDSPR